jgi:hypothetical protein
MPKGLLPYRTSSAPQNPHRLYVRTTSRAITTSTGTARPEIGFPHMAQKCSFRAVWHVSE